MSNEDVFDVPLKVRFRDDRLRTFKSAKQLRRWADSDLEKWRAFQAQTEPVKPFTHPNPADELVNRATQIGQQAAGYMESPDDAARQAHYDRLEPLLKPYTDDPNFVSAVSPFGKRVREFANDDPEAAVVMLSRGFGQSIPTNSVASISDYVDAVLRAERTLDEAPATLHADRESLESAREDWTDFLENASTTLEDREQQGDGLARRLVEKLMRTKTQYERMRQDHEGTLAAMRTAFSTDMKLKASEKFWNAKRKVNKTRAQNAFKEFLWSIAYGIFFLGYTYWFIFKAIGAGAGFSVFHAIAYTAPAVLVLWILRILATRYRVNMAMADDAEERMAMVMTFKALEYEEKVSEEERIIILQALFRPHDRAPEETLPLPAWEAMTKRLHGADN